jgi:hypothetical protein
MADIIGLTAGIGGGKSFKATCEILGELERTERFIVTDVPLVLSDPPEGKITVADYCHQWMAKPVDLNKRLVVLSSEQATQFWRYLPAEYYLAKWGEKQFNENVEKYGLTIETNKWKHGHCTMLKLPNKPNSTFKEVTDFSFREPQVTGDMIGCFYVIDEAHKKFPPMYYQKVGAQCEWYMSELRKLNDDFMWITQHPEKVDKNFRRNTTQWIKVTNMEKTRLFMGVTFKKKFRYHVYEQQEVPTRTDKPDTSGWYQLDPKKRIQDCYLTMAGTGVGGGVGHEQKRFKGNHWGVWLVAAVLVLVGAYLAPRLLLHGMSAAMSSVVGGMVHGSQQGMSKLVGANNLATNTPPKQPTIYRAAPRTNVVTDIYQPPGASPRVSPARPEYALPPGVSGLKCNGWYKAGTNLYALLSDGTSIDSTDGELIDVGTHRIKTKTYGLIEMATPEKLTYRPANDVPTAPN